MFSCENYTIWCVPGVKFILKAPSIYPPFTSPHTPGCIHPSSDYALHCMSATVP